MNGGRDVPMIDGLWWVGAGATPGTDWVRPTTSRSQRVQSVRGRIRECGVGVQLYNRVSPCGLVRSSCSPASRERIRGCGEDAIAQPTRTHVAGFQLTCHYQERVGLRIDGMIA